jgi:hypothetical protein
VVRHFRQRRVLYEKFGNKIKNPPPPKKQNDNIKVIIYLLIDFSNFKGRPIFLIENIILKLGNTILFFRGGGIFYFISSLINKIAK